MKLSVNPLTAGGKQPALPLKLLKAKPALVSKILIFTVLLASRANGSDGFVEYASKAGLFKEWKVWIWSK